MSLVNDCKNIVVFKHLYICRNIYRDDSRIKTSTINKWREVEELFKRFNHELYNIKRQFRYGCKGVALLNARQKGMLLFKRGLCTQLIYIIIRYTEPKAIIGNYNKFMYGKNK